MNNKQVLITGVRNEQSIAWYTAARLIDQGARVSFSCHSDREAEALRSLLHGRSTTAPVFLCDATDEQQTRDLCDQLFAGGVRELHGLVHAIAFAKKGDLQEGLISTGRTSFDLCLETSAFSLVGLCASLRPLMAAAHGASVVAYTFVGSERAVPHYNVVGVAKAALEAEVRYLAAELGPEAVRVNALSAGPLRTLSSGGIPGFEQVIDEYARRSCLKRNVTADEVASAACFLLSDGASGISGETIYVDGGFRAAF